MGGLPCHKGVYLGKGDFPGVSWDGVGGLPGISSGASSMDDPQEGRTLGGQNGSSAPSPTPRCWVFILQHPKNVHHYQWDHLPSQLH